MGKDWDSFDTFPLRDRTKEASKGGFKDAKKAPRGMGLGFDGVNNSPMARRAFIEQSSEYCDIARSRIAHAQREQGIFAECEVGA